MSIAYNVLKLNETTTVMSYPNTVLTHTKSALLLRVSNHLIHDIIDHQIALSCETDQMAEFHIVLILI